MMRRSTVGAQCYSRTLTACERLLAKAYSAFRFSLESSADAAEDLAFRRSFTALIKHSIFSRSSAPWLVLSNLASGLVASSLSAFTTPSNCATRNRAMRLSVPAATHRAETHRGFSRSRNPRRPRRVWFRCQHRLRHHHHHCPQLMATVLAKNPHGWPPLHRY